MAEDFPDPEDEFDLMHEDEYEVLRELEAEQRSIVNNVSQKQKNNCTQPTSSTQKSVRNDTFEKQNEFQATAVIENHQNHLEKSESENNDVFQKQNELQVTAVIENHQNHLNKPETENQRKRSIDEVLKNTILETLDLRDFDDIDSFEIQEKKRPCWDRPQELMKLILEKRQNVQNNNEIKSNNPNYNLERDLKDSISRKVPLCNFIAVTRCDDGERFYIKVSDKNKYEPTTNYRKTSCSLLRSFNKLKEEAEQIILNSIEKASISSLETVSNESSSCELWVDKYRPKRYLELLSDENVNRSLLYWLKLWDKIVFDRDPTVRPRKKQVFSKFKNKFKKKEEDIPDYDSKGFPTQRIALLTGPPGLGKTTLAHVAAKHAGYNIVELNASDDRGPEAFREALLASTQMRAVIDQEKRPNCLVLDEIDGAPSASIELLLKFIHGKLAPKGKNAKTKENDGCRRPIICICNDLYTPSLRPLRTMALVISVPEINPSILVDRLSQIVRKEGLRVDSRILLQLAERSACDVRACLGILQYTGGKANMLKSLAFGLKDMRKGLFDSWKEMLQIPMTRKGPLSETERASKVISIVHQSEPDRLVQGIFHNYPDICNEKIVPVSDALHWFELYDQINQLVMERQCWILMPYTTSAFVAWHLYLASSKSSRISYPTTLFEVNQKLERTVAILNVTKRTAKMDSMTLVVDVLPYLPDLLSPRLRSVNVQLFSPAEKAELNKLVNLMLDFGLTFIQEKKAEGGYEYNLDPNIWNIGTFPDCKVRRPLTYAVKQIVIQELETARLQRAAILNGEAVQSTPKFKKPPAVSVASTASSSKIDSSPSLSQAESKEQENLPNHLRQLNPVQLQPTKVEKCRNFFLAFQAAGQEKLKQKRAKEKEQGITEKQTSPKEEMEKNLKRTKSLLKGDVWYQYKEGYSNAVRRTVLMEDIL